MATQVSICNMALSNIGIKKQISAIDDPNQEAEMCLLHYDVALEEALAEGDWGFARRRVDLVTEAGTPPEPWAYQYQYPSNCAAIRRIDDERASRHSDSRIPFTTETNDSNARIVFTDQEDAVVIYTRLETTPTLYSAAFVRYMSWVLASKIAMPLTGDEDLAEGAEKMAMHELEKAFSKNLENEQEPPEPQASWISAREGDVPVRPGQRADDYWT
jgi:hypothetical protein